METLEQVAIALRVLAHAHRLRIVDLLDHDDHTVGELAEQLGIPASACSQHLNLMRAHGLLTSQRVGKTVRYQVDHPSATSVLNCIRNHHL